MKSKKLIYAVLITLCLVGVAVAVYFLVSKASKDNSQPVKSVFEQRMDSGKKAEDHGETAKAVEMYTAASKLCSKDDAMCTLSTEIKVKSLTKVLEDEKAAAAAKQ